MAETNKHPTLELEYMHINNNFRFMVVRLKLLALVPTLGGADIFVLARAGLEAGTAPASATPELLVGLFGFLATLGITLCDRQNSELYSSWRVALDRREMQRYDTPARQDSIKEAEPAISRSGG